MKTIISELRKSKSLLLYLFPFYCILTGAFFRILLGDLSLSTIDPDYVYFSNGLDISLGIFNTGNIFHPGAPLQYFTAIIFRLIFLLRSPKVSYLEDIYTHSDLYLSVASFCFIGILSILLLVAGSKVYKYTDSILAGILIQATPFLPLIWYDIVGRLTPEIFQAVAVLALSVMVIKCYKTGNGPLGYSGITILALISAFGMSAKVTFLPLLIIPFIIIEGMKKKILFLILTIIIFILISVSVLLKLDVFWSWIRNIFIHSGDYGGGEANILDLQRFKINLVYLVLQEKFFFQIVLASIVIQIAYITIFRKKIKRRALLHTIAICLAIGIHLLMVSKHFAHRNYIPSLLLMPLLVYFSVEVVKQFNEHYLFKSVANILILIFFMFFFKSQLVWLPIKSEAIGNHIKALEETRRIASTLENESIKIITSQDYGAPFIEYALMYSTVWSNRRQKAQYDEVLAKLYPNTYQHTTFHDRFEYWGSPFDVKQIIDGGTNVYLYIERDDEQLYNWTISKLKEEDQSDFIVEREPFFKNEVSTEVIYKLHFQLLEETN